MKRDTTNDDENVDYRVFLMNQYIITEDLLDAIKYEAQGLEMEVTQRFLGCADIFAGGLADCAKTMYEIERRVRSNPYNPQADREKVLFAFAEWDNSHWITTQRIGEYLEELRQKDDEFVATGCGGGVKRILGDSGIRLKWKEDKDGE